MNEWTFERSVFAAISKLGLPIVRQGREFTVIMAFVAGGLLIDSRVRNTARDLETAPANIFPDLREQLA